ncbi:hypothetical protein ASD04_14910 [Devosia sp. Root436]|uniref:hypothetical protein n=1 Tax=Devosia sp. Root436 TaxID=1736537 RepID=UPI0006F5C1B6|nr:hypothetical protein [Devosia sp. Root436]KQX35328.1 hypothetical protein ASD04_14910 [Devosia sp. Root436]
MDIVYPYKSAPDDLELRYSLRSLANVPHDRVFVAGDKPLIIGPAVQHVPEARIDDRYQSSTANIVAAIWAGDIKGQFVVMHDDIFVLRPWVFRHEHRGTIAEYLRSGEASGEYRSYIESTRDILVSKGIADPLWFGLHTPTVYDAQRLLEMVEGFEGHRYLLRTLYHNLHPAPAARRGDVKARLWGEPSATADILSISDDVARSHSFRRWIAARFPDRCRYEIATTGKCLILGYGPTLWVDVEQALDGADYAAVIASPEAAEHWPGDVLAIAHDDDHADRIARSIGFDDVTWCGRTKEAA